MLAVLMHFRIVYVHTTVCLFVCCGSTPTFSVLCLAKYRRTPQVVDSNFVPEFVIFKERCPGCVRLCRKMMRCCVKMDYVTLLGGPSTSVIHNISLIRHYMT